MSSETRYSCDRCSQEILSEDVDEATFQASFGRRASLYSAAPGWNRQASGHLCRTCRRVLGVDVMPESQREERQPTDAERLEELIRILAQQEIEEQSRG